MRESASSIKRSLRGKGSRLIQRPRADTDVGRVYNRLVDNVGCYVDLHDIGGDRIHLHRKIGYLRTMYNLDIRATGGLPGATGKCAGSLPGKHALVGIIDGRAYIDLVANPELAATLKPKEHTQ